MGWGLGTAETAKEVPQEGSRDQGFSSSTGHTSHQGSLGDRWWYGWAGMNEAYDATFSRKLLVSLDPPQPKVHNLSEKVSDFGL